jgi:hypothetical protein
VSNIFAILRLLPMGGRHKDVEILALRHEISVLERRLGRQWVRFIFGDRAFLAALLHGLPTQVLRRLRLVVRPDTVLRWHRDLNRPRLCVCMPWGWPVDGWQCLGAAGQALGVLGAAAFKCG